MQSIRDSYHLVELLVLYIDGTVDITDKRMANIPPCFCKSNLAMWMK